MTRQRRAAPSAFSYLTESGSTLVEVLVATLILVTGVLAMSQLFLIAATTNMASRRTTVAAALAAQKVEQLRALTWGFDVNGQPVSDLATDTSVVPASPSGGSGLGWSPSTALARNTPGYVDHLDPYGRTVGNGEVPPRGAAYTRRWSVEPLPASPDRTLVIHVLVTRSRLPAGSTAGHVLGEARLLTLRTRKGP